MTQPSPVLGKIEVTPLVIADLQKRSDSGLQSYGVRLMTHNGRDALQDLYEELLDGACYAKQRLVEDAPAMAVAYEACAKIAERDYPASTADERVYGRWIAWQIRDAASRLISDVEKDA